MSLQRREIDESAQKLERIYRFHGVFNTWWSSFVSFQTYPILQVSWRYYGYTMRNNLIIRKNTIRSIIGRGKTLRRNVWRYHVGLSYIFLLRRDAQFHSPLVCIFDGFSILIPYWLLLIFKFVYIRYSLGLFSPNIGVSWKTPFSILVNVVPHLPWQNLSS